MATKPNGFFFQILSSCLILSRACIESSFHGFTPLWYLVKPLLNVYCGDEGVQSWGTHENIQKGFVDRC